MQTASDASTIPQSDRFEDRAVVVMRELRESFLGVMESLPRPIDRAADLERTLGVSSTLAWQIHRLATSTNPLRAGAQVPGVAAVKQVLRAAESAGVPPERLQAAAHAMDAFESLVKRHAGERTTFTTMINSLAGPEAEEIDLKTRRQAFRVNSQAWGMQVKTSLACGLYHPGRSSDTYDMLAVRGLRDIRRLRTSARFRLGSQRLTDGQNRETEQHPVGHESPDSPHGPNLLLDFCTQPCPELENQVEGDLVHTYLRDTPLGNAGLQSLYMADVTRSMHWRSAEGMPNVQLNCASVAKPIETLVLDVLFHRGMFGPLDPTVTVYGMLDRPVNQADPHTYRPEEAVPIRAEAERLGIGASVLSTPYVPRYREMIESVCRDVGWDADEFEVFRCVIEYPLLNTAICMRFDLPDQGNWP